MAGLSSLAGIGSILNPVVEKGRPVDATGLTEIQTASIKQAGQHTAIRKSSWI
jgi:hypothetical protein